jgi:hypothetical protein
MTVRREAADRTCAGFLSPHLPKHLLTISRRIERKNSQGIVVLAGQHIRDDGFQVRRLDHSLVEYCCVRVEAIHDQIKILVCMIRNDRW